MAWIELIAAIAGFALDPIGACERWTVPLGLTMLAVAMGLMLDRIGR